MISNDRQPACRRCVRSAIVILVFMVAGTTSLAAHDEGVLKPATRVLTAGDSLTLGGEQFTKNSGLAVWLVGIAGRFRMASVRVDSAGSFATKVLVPTDAAAGAYRLTAIAGDGDEVASVDVTVEAAEAAAHRDSAFESDAMDMEEPTAAPLMLSPARSAALTWSVIGGIVVALAMSVVMFRRAGTG